MKTFRSLQEERGEKAYKQAMTMGLKYGGFGYWKDPQTNETVYKTENDTLVPVEPREESELAAKGGPGAGGGRPDPMGGAGGMAGGAGMMGAGGMLQMPGGGMPGEGIQGAPEPGKEQVDQESGWEPGPDGDTCVGPEAETPADVPEDSFVGRTNFIKWVAGPDGDNMNTVSLGDLKEQIKESETKRSSWPKTGDGTNTLLKKLGHPPVSSTGQDSSTHEYEYNSDPGRTLGQIQRNARPNVLRKEQGVVDKMNQGMRGFMQQPDYKLDQFDDDEDGDDFVGGGAFGKAFRDKQGNIVKKGRIGPGEISALHAMKDNPAFPNLINAKLDSQFIHQSPSYNNPHGEESQKRDGDMTEYWDPDEEGDFHRQFPSAFGTYAMSAAEGSELYDSWFGLDKSMKDKVMRNFWKARGDLHKAGFSHNDMHGGNVMVDPETGEVNIIDLGLAKENKLSAFMEALGGLDFEEGNDYQLAPQVSGGGFTERMEKMSVKNREAVEEALMDSFDGDMDEVDMDDKAGELAELMLGNIRMRDDDFSSIKEKFPYLADDNNVSKLIEMLYNEIGGTEQQDRMSDAFEKKQKDTKLIDAANKIRRAQGKKDIPIKNKAVIPPKNMDFDD